MPTLHWIGKDKVINHHMDVPFKVGYSLSVIRVDTQAFVKN
jgi:hypothetical protein